MEKISIKEDVRIPGTDILLEKGDVILYKEDMEGTELRRLDVPEKEINFLLDGCSERVLDAVITIGKSFRGSFNISYSGYGAAEMYNPLNGAMVEVSDKEISITTDDDSIEFDTSPSGVSAAIKYIKKIRR